MFLAEAILKALGGAIFILFPTTILHNLSNLPFSPVSVSLVKSLGTQTITFSIPLFLASRSRSLDSEARKLVYWSVLAREGFLLAGLLGQILELQIGWVDSSMDIERRLEEGREMEARSEKENMAEAMGKLRKGLWFWIAELVPFVVGRVWILKWRSEWF